jgi:hypothetical protein
VTVQRNDAKTDLTLSAASELVPAFSGALTAQPGYPTVFRDPRCPACVARVAHVDHTRYSRPDVVDVPIRSERDRLTPALLAERVTPALTESEQRALWGDR